MIKFEICVDSFHSAQNAIKGGADRLEVCSVLGLGGVTPSLSLVEKILEQSKIPVHVLIRPRAGDFIYDEPEIQIMVNDIRQFKKLGVHGFVFGVLNKFSRIDEEKCSILLENAKPLPVTFHRAFDVLQNPVKSLVQIMRLKFDRLLTSGQQENAWKGRKLISNLIRQAANDIIIMPGGGINEENIAPLIQATHCGEIHFSARKKMTANKKWAALFGNHEIADPQRIRAMRKLAKALI